VTAERPPGAAFFPVQQEPNHARLSFSGSPDDRLVHGISELGRLLHHATRANGSR
jgi:2-aminoadipate transaminase